MKRLVIDPEVSLELEGDEVTLRHVGAGEGGDDLTIIATVEALQEAVEHLERIIAKWPAPRGGNPATPSVCDKPPRWGNPAPTDRADSGEDGA